MASWHGSVIAIGVLFGFLILVACVLVALHILNPVPEMLVPRPYGDRFELDDLSHSGDLERGGVDGDNGEGESTPRAVLDGNIVQRIARPSNVGLEYARAMAQADTRNLRGPAEPVMGGSLLVHDDDDETELIPSDAPLSRRKSLRLGKGKGKGKGKPRAIEIKDDADSEVFSISPLDGHRGGAEYSPRGMYFVPTPVIANRPRGRSITERPVLSELLSSPGPSRRVELPDPSEFEVAETTFWKPSEPPVSRYRGLSATSRPVQKKPLPPSPPQPAPVEKDDVQDASASSSSMPLPDPAAFDLGNRPDSWEYFSGDNEDYDSDEWTSQVCSTVLGPRQAEDARAPSLAARLVGGDAPAAAAASASAPVNNNENNKNNNNNQPAWELGGPSPDHRILTRKATMPGRQAKFVEVDIDDLSRDAAAPHSPVEMTVFQECLELLREGAKSPDITTELGVGSEEEPVGPQPALFRGDTWFDMSGSALFQRRRGNSDDGGEGSSKSKIAGPQPALFRGNTWIDTSGSPLFQRRRGNSNDGGEGSSK